MKRSAICPATGLDELFRSGECRENDAFGERTSRVFSERLTCLVIVKFNEVSHICGACGGPYAKRVVTSAEKGSRIIEG
jgi:predicted RNA-binding Zn-ribbon protein involved in translation (DUF1610 family)